MNKIEFILLKMIFNEELLNSIMAENLTQVEKIFSSSYKEEIKEKMVDDVPLTQKDISYIKKEHLKENKADTYEWAL